jgi:hypothetical protein
MSDQKHSIRRNAEPLPATLQSSSLSGFAEESHTELFPFGLVYELIEQSPSPKQTGESASADIVSAACPGASIPSHQG